MRSDYLSAAQAIDLLGIRAQTLYAYVSRGWIRSVARPGHKDRLYDRDDVERVRQRSQARAGHGAVAASAMNWGEPILRTGITEITPQGPRYRGRLAADLVREGAAFEAVAELLWTGQLPPDPPHWPVHRPPPGLLSLVRTMSMFDPQGNVLEAFAMIVLMLGLGRGSTAERLARGDTLPAAREIIQAMVACCGFIGPAQRYRPMRRGETVVQALMRVLGVAPTPDNNEALRALLILLADHELPPGTLGARVVASAGGSLQSCLAAAFCATSGVETARVYAHVQAFLGHPQTRAPLVRRARQSLALGQGVPGFHHPLYPAGDPRAAQLLAITRQRRDPTRELRALFGFLDTMREAFGLHPRQEFAVVVLARAMALPPQAAAALFALGRLAGWTAHVLEQRADGSMLRPRAHFSPGDQR
ncbi:MAG: 2-methylcitrate synthase [Paracidovorax wautersii]|uniref:citrate synthase (unknown stereospecificity) n=1 Tax=Paracidovorax wautersii TaxID=1177982 RepID=A0A7V8JRM1_9BURK|nr:MAG: 2-methylcitrate synthase [Paracidovorax wautersii]